MPFQRFDGLWKRPACRAPRKRRPAGDEWLGLLAQARKQAERRDPGTGGLGQRGGRGREVTDLDDLLVDVLEIEPDEGSHLRLVRHDGGGGVEGWDDASETFNVTLELVKRGYTKKQIEKLWSGNLLRVLDQVQKVAQKMQK